MAVPLNNLLNESKTALKTENSNVDITLSALKDAITKTGETVKTLADVVDALSNVTIGSALPEGTNVVGAVVNKNADGDEIFTESNPGAMQLTGSNVAIKIAGNTVSVNESVSLTPGNPTTITFTEQVTVTIQNIGPGSCHIAFDGEVAGEENYILQENGFLKSVSCISISLLSPDSAPTIQVIGGVENV